MNTTEVPVNRTLPQQDPALDSLGIVVGEIAHDFNNVLALIFGYVELALSDIPESEHARSDLELVLAAGDRARELVARILTYSNRTNLKRERLAVTRTVRQALKVVAERVTPGITLKSSFAEDECFVLGNETELAQIVMNLCNNSLQAIPATGGSIDVTLEAIDEASSFFQQHPGLVRGNHVVLTIRDSGRGMDQATLEKMYLPFFTTSRGNDAQALRAGLGLTTVYNIVASMQGVIFASSAPGAGSTFQICLPQMVDAQGENKKLIPESPVRSAKRVLFIDDEPAITEMASHILNQSGYKAQFFNDGNEALDYFTRHPHDFDIIVTDLKMPQISGADLASRCAALNPDIPIILTTGFSEKISLSNCSEWGVTTIITKPFSIGQLLTTLEELTKQQDLP